MFQQTPQKRVLFRHTLTLAVMGLFGVVLPLFISILVAVISPQSVHAAALSNTTMNFQARLEGPGGNIAADGFYNIRFKLYDGDTAGGSAGAGRGFAGTQLWTEAYYDVNGVTAGQDNRVKVINGYITVSLGSQTAFPTTINWDQELWLTMDIGGTTQTATPTYDGEMNPRLMLTGVPYAFKAGSLATYNSGTGYTSTLSILQPTAGNQTFQVANQGTGGTYNICVQNASVANGGCAASTGAAGYIQNQNAAVQTATNFWISGTGRADTGLQAPSLTTTSGALTLTGAGGVTVSSGNGTTSSNVMIQTGNASAGVSGNIVLDNGTFTSGTPAITIGALNSRNVSVGNTVSIATALNLYAGTTGGINIGSFGASTLGSTVNISNTTNGTGVQGISIGSNANASNSVTIEAGNTGQIQIGNSNASHSIQIGAAGTSTAQLINIGSAGNTNSSLTLQGGILGSAVVLQTGANAGTAGGIVIGNTTGTNTQSISLGTNATASSTTNINIGSSVAGTTAITGTTTVTGRTSGSATAFTASNSTSTGNIAQFNDNSTAVFTLADGGNAVFRNLANSTSAFQVQHAGGSTLLNVDTLGGEVSVAGTVNGIALNKQFVHNNDSALHNYKIASLPISSAGSYDHMRMTVTLNPDWLSTTNSYLDVTFANRSGFTYRYDVSGAAVNSAASLKAYNNSGIIDIYLSFSGSPNPFTAGSYTVLENQGAVVHGNPTDFGASPTGTLIFDASSATYPASRYTATNGNQINRGTVLLKATADSATAFQVQDASGSSFLTVDTAADTVLLGTALTNSGSLTFRNATNTNTVSLVSGVTTATYSLTLPTTAPTTGQCLKSNATTASQLEFGACGSGLAKNATDTSSAAVAASGNLYTFTNSSSAVASGILKLDNGNNTGSALQITATAGNLLDLQQNTTSRFTVNNTGTLNINSAAGASAFAISGANGTVPAQAGGGGTMTGGIGGTAVSGVGNGGAGGAFSFTAGAGGAANTSASPGTGGGVSITSGAGGAGASGAVGGVAGNVTLQGGAGGATGGIGGGAGGSIVLMPGVAGLVSTNGKVVIGSSTGATDAAQYNLQLDSYNTFIDTGACSTTTNQGSIYYSTNTHAIRGCVNGAWEDVVTSAGLGLLLFGVLPDSGIAADQGDWASIGGATKGPCKVSWVSATSVSVAPCVAYSGGRKAVVSTATTVNLPAMAANWVVHICFSTTSGSPYATAGGAATANFPTFSASNPILCIADVLNSGSTANTIAKIYDTRTFTTTRKSFVTNHTTLAELGAIVAISGTTVVNGVSAAPNTTNTGNLSGVVIAQSSAVSTTAITTIIATGGPQWVKYMTGAGTLNSRLGPQTGAFSSYAGNNSTATASLELYSILGLQLKLSDNTTCTSSANCQMSVPTDISIR